MLTVSLVKAMPLEVRRGKESCPRHFHHPQREGGDFVSTNRSESQTMSKTGKRESREWMSVPQAAEMLGCSDVWVLKLIKTNELEGFRLSGRSWAVSTRSVEKNLQEYLRKKDRSGRPRAKFG